MLSLDCRSDTLRLSSNGAVSVARRHTQFVAKSWRNEIQIHLLKEMGLSSLVLCQRRQTTLLHKMNPLQYATVVRLKSA